MASKAVNVQNYMMIDDESFEEEKQQDKGGWTPIALKKIDNKIDFRKGVEESKSKKVESKGTY